LFGLEANMGSLVAQVRLRSLGHILSGWIETVRRLVRKLNFHPTKESARKLPWSGLATSTSWPGQTTATGTGKSTLAASAAAGRGRRVEIKPFLVEGGETVFLFDLTPILRDNY